MKKLYIVLAAASVVCGASAKEITFYMGNEVVTPGKTIYVNEYDYTDYGGGIGEFKFNPEISIKTDQSGTLTIIANCETNPVQLCCGGACVKNNNVVKDNINVAAGQPLVTEFEFADYTYDYDPVPEDVYATLSAQFTDDASTLKTLEFIFNSQTGAVSVIEVGNSVRYANSAILCDIEGATGISLYDAQGRCIKTAALSAGAVSTEGLPAGIYLYKVNGADRSGKIIVK